MHQTNAPSRVDRGASNAKAGCAIAILVGLGSCVGAAAFFGMGLVEEELLVDLQRNPVIQEQIGTIESLELDWGKSTDDERVDFFWYDIAGDRGHGVVEAHSESTGPDMTEELVDGRLTMANGEVFDLVPVAGAEAAPGPVTPEAGKTGVGVDAVPEEARRAGPEAERDAQP